MRIVLDNIGPEYKHCVTRIVDLVKVTKMMTNAGGIVDYGNIPDAYDRSFSDAWLPSWKLLQASLISEYRSKLKAIEGKAEEKQVKAKLPVAVGGFREVQCYSCGGPHKKGDVACKAGPFDVHECAPADFKKKQEDKKRKYGGKGELGGGNAHPNKRQKNDEKRNCRFFNFGKGTCRNGAKCNFLHDKKQGNGNAKEQANANDNKGGGMFGKKQKQQLASMVATEFKKCTKELAKKIKKNKNGKGDRSKKNESSSDSDDESFSSMMAKVWLSPIINTIPRDPVRLKTLVFSSNLHSVDQNCGIDTDAGMSISTLLSDFPLGIDERKSVLERLC